MLYTLLDMQNHVIQLSIHHTRNSIDYYRLLHAMASSPIHCFQSPGAFPVNSFQSLPLVICEYSLQSQ